MNLNKHTIIENSCINSNIQNANKFFKENDIKFNGEYLKLDRKDAIAIEILKVNKIHGKILFDPYEQTVYGDLTTNSEDNVEIKTFYVWYGINVLSADMEYFACDSEGCIIYEDGKKVPFEQGYFNDCLGWVYNLKECDILFLVNEKLGIFYTIENFQAMRENLMKHYEEGTEPIGIHLGWTNDHNKKLTRVFHLHLDKTEYIEAIGGKITKYTFEII